MRSKSLPLARAEVDLVAWPPAFGKNDRIRILGDFELIADRTLEDEIGRELEAHRVQPAQHAGVAPACPGPQIADPVAHGPLDESVEQAPADAPAARVGTHRDQLEAKARLGAAEFAFEHARQDEAVDAVFAAGRELRVQFRLAQRGGEPAFDVGAARPAFDRGVDRDDGVEVAARERADRPAGGEGLAHGTLLLLG